MTGNFLIQCKTRKMEVLQFLAVAFGSYVFGIIVMMIIRANTIYAFLWYHIFFCRGI